MGTYIRVAVYAHNGKLGVRGLICFYMLVFVYRDPRKSGGAISLPAIPHTLAMSVPVSK